jgi:hypothetical protein
MKLLERLRNRPPAGTADSGPAEADAAEHQLPIARYDELDDRGVVDHLPRLSRVELGAVETYERSHRRRPAALNKLRYMRGTEPLPRRSRPR